MQINCKHFKGHHHSDRGFPDSSGGKESACSVGDLGPIFGLGRSPGVGNGNSLQYCGLENPMDRGAWRATVHGVTESQTPLKQLSMHAYTTNLYVYTFILFRQPWDPPTLSLFTNKDPALHIKITQFS